MPQRETGDARIDITDHAVMRYVQRHAPGLPHVRARADIEHLAAKATPLRKRSLGGQQLWRVDEPPMLLVIKPDSGRYVCVTVLPSSAEEGETEAIDSEIVSAYERIRHLVERGATTDDEKALRANIGALCGRLREQLDSLKSSREAVKRDLGALLAAATGDATAPAPTKGVERHATDVLRAQVAAMARKHEKQVAHGKLMADDRNRARRVLAVALRALARARDPGARAAFDAITQAEPWTADPSYWDGTIDLHAPAGDIEARGADDQGESAC